ncbi:hypothetical protein ACFL60_04450 [Candidatus Omnitrophota bacterium]
MKEIHLRKWHRTIGTVIAFFLLLQVLTGIVLSVEDILGSYLGSLLHDLHDGFGIIGGAYRIVLGIGFLWMIITGGILSFNIRRRMQKRG